MDPIIQQFRGAADDIVTLTVAGVPGGYELSLSRADVMLMFERFVSSADALARTAAMRDDLLGKGWTMDGQLQRGRAVAAKRRRRAAARPAPPMEEAPS